MRRETTPSTARRTFAAVRRELERWRRDAGAGHRRRLPEALWQAAIELAGAHGVSRTARELRLGYYALQRRVVAMQEGKAAFVEVAVPPLVTSSPECRIELEDGRGTRLRVELRGPGLGSLESAIRALWSEGR